MTAPYGPGAKHSADVERAMSMDGFFADEQSVEAPPSADDDFETRAAWARAIVSRVSAQASEQRTARVALPDDIRPSHFWEVEYQSALVDPIAYARSMRENERAFN